MTVQTRTTEYPRTPEALPADSFRAGKYVVRFARSEADLVAVLRIRYEVFNLELAEGLDESHATGLDRDRFDAVCHHLMIETTRGKLVGTYRMQTAEMAAGEIGYYTAGEFDLATVPPEIERLAIELGRACILERHRNSQALFALWKGLVAYLQHNSKRYLFGCCSLTSQDPLEGIRTLERLSADGYLHPSVRVVPRAGFECVPGPADAGRRVAVKIPKLFGTYLRIGAKVCGAPAIDREFKTIDFLVLLDILELDARTHRLLFA